MKDLYRMKNISLIFVLILICTFNLIYLVSRTCAEEPKRVSASSTQNELEADRYHQMGIEAFEKENYSKAIIYYSKALESDPFNSLVYFDRALAHEHLGELEQAILDHTRAIKFDNSFDGAYFFRGIIWEKKGEPSKAIKDYTEAIKIYPKDSWYFFKRAYVKHGLGDNKGAIEDYNHSIKLSPDLYNAYNNLSWLYSTCLDSQYRDGEKALALAQKAIELNRGGDTLDSLAAAYAELGKFDIAVKIQNEVLTLINRADEPELYSKASDRLSHYKSKLPWREQ